MLKKIQLDTSTDVYTALAIVEEIRTCSINCELIEPFDDESSTYDDFIIEVNLAELGPIEAFTAGMVVQDCIDYHMSMMYEERRAIERQEYENALKTCDEIFIPFKLEDFADMTW